MVMRTYKVMVEPLDRAMKLLMTDLDGNELLRAVLPAFPRHPRALLTLLEGLALWVDSRIHTAISVGPRADARSVEALFNGDLLPLDTALVHFELVGAAQRRRTIRGVGDFRQLKLALRRCA